MVIKVKDGSIGIGIGHSILTPVRGVTLIDPIVFESTSKEKLKEASFEVGQLFDRRMEIASSVDRQKRLL